MFLVIIIIMQNISNAVITRPASVSVEKIIPFSFVSDEQELEEYLNIKGLSNVKIKDMYVDNGSMTANISGNYIEVEFSEGEWANSYKTVNKIETEDIEAVMTNQVDKTIIVTPTKEAKNIQSVSGDFESAKIKDNGEIEIVVRESAEGISGYDSNSLVKSQFSINIDDKNLSRNIKKEVILPYEVQGNVKIVSGDTSMVQDISVEGNEVIVEFDNGIPTPNETIINSGHTFFWIDRDENGYFKKYNPNSIYSTDINQVTGLGEYIGENEKGEIGTIVENPNWKDYCGIEKDGVRYIYVFDSSVGIPKSFQGHVVESDEITFYDQNFNSEKYSVSFSNTDVSYVPEGKLYSMGELVKNTNGWGEISPNRDWESKKTFFNELTGKYETYVKHFKFFYGPKQKKTFGGYYTYPYACTFEYQHYKPITLYSGEIAYEYESQEKIKGYSYNGWVKIEYKQERQVNDYPPTAPFNVKYNKITGNILWGAAKDDYTAVEDIRYEIQIFDGEWKTIIISKFEDLKFNYKIEYPEADVRIKSIDEYNQYSEWSYASKSEIELEGKLEPYIVKPGDSIDIFANTKSLDKIESVIAKSDEMQMYLELQKTGENTSNFVEISYDIRADFPEDTDEFFTIANGRVANGDKEEISSYKFEIKEEFDEGDIDFEFSRKEKMNKNGTLIFSNLNYSDMPVEWFVYDSKSWLIKFNNIIYIKNKVINSQEKFLEVKTETEIKKVGDTRYIIPKHQIVVNKFQFNEKGKSTYEYIDVDKNLLIKPLVVTWNTDVSGDTEVSVYAGNELIYVYKAKWEDINKHVDSFYGVYMYKQMKKFKKTQNGYINPSSTHKANWNKIVLSIVPKYDLRGLTWLGYRVRNNEYVRQAYVDEYNNNLNVRNNYRVLISDDFLSEKAINRYLDILKTTNISMTRDKETIFGDDVMEYTSTFQHLDIKVPENLEAGTYKIDLLATDVQGKMAETTLILIVQKEEKQEDDNIDLEEEKTEGAILDSNVGRFFYRNGKGYLEELKKTYKINDNGFICAGETLGAVLVAKDTEYIEIDLLGDESIKNLDYLTEKFLIDIPREKGEDIDDISNQYNNFPQKIYPQHEDNNMNVFKWFYIVPYKTEQSLASWSTLKNDTLEAINTEMLFDRIKEPYTMIIYPNGDKEKAVYIEFDVFERWDTILNRDVTKYVTNSSTKWEMRLDK